MTTLYLYHDLIEASETGDTVLSLFGQWWDGDAGGGGGGAMPWLVNRTHTTTIVAGVA